MMRHVLRVGVLMFTMGLFGSGHAEAGGLWDWLEELNGPGPSATRGNFMMNFACRRTDEIVRPVKVEVKTESIDPAKTAALTPILVDSSTAKSDTGNPSTTLKTKTVTTT